MASSLDPTSSIICEGRYRDDDSQDRRPITVILLLIQMLLESVRRTHPTPLELCMTSYKIPYPPMLTRRGNGLMTSVYN